MSGHHAWNMPFGAQPLGDGRWRFALWAPGQRQVLLELGHDRLPMRALADGWHAAEADAGDDARYRFRLQDGLAVPDPASRSQPDGVDGESALLLAGRFRWQNVQWSGRPWREAVLYELHVGALGGYKGVQAQLPRLAALGVTALELMPLAQGPGRRNWGYDGVLPFAPTAAYGTPDELKALIDAAHGHGLMVLLDVVYNHFGPQGNYLPRYAPAFFRDDVDTPWGQAIDFRQPAVREYFIHNACYWLHEYRFDGLRFDAVHAIVGRDFLVEMSARIRATVEPGRHVHLVLENDDNDADLLREGYTAQWNDDAHHVLHVALTGEREGYYADYASPAAPDLARWLGEGFVYQGQASRHRDGAPRGTPASGLPPTAFVAFLQNHDQIGNRAFGERLTTLADPAALRVALALLLLAPQVPMLFMGEEWGSRQPFLYFTDYHGELADAVREGRRREFARFAAFADEARRARIPDPNDAATFRDSVPDQVAALTGPGARHHAWVQELLHLRARAIAPFLDGARALGASPAGDAAVCARWQLGDGRRLRIAANLGAAEVGAADIGVEAACREQLLFELDAGQAAKVAAGQLPGYALVAWLTDQAGQEAA